MFSSKWPLCKGLWLLIMQSYWSSQVSCLFIYFSLQIMTARFITVSRVIFFKLFTKWSGTKKKQNREKFLCMMMSGNKQNAGGDPLHTVSASSQPSHWCFWFIYHFDCMNNTVASCRWKTALLIRKHLGRSAGLCALAAFTEVDGKTSPQPILSNLIQDTFFFF